MLERFLRKYYVFMYTNFPKFAKKTKKFPKSNHCANDKCCFCYFCISHYLLSLLKLKFTYAGRGGAVYFCYFLALVTACCFCFSTISFGLVHVKLFLFLLFLSLFSSVNNLPSIGKLFAY